MQGFSTGGILPIQIPMPCPRMSSILPYSINGPFKRSLMALFELAWESKLQLPILITVAFMAFDIQLQLEINIFWEQNNRNRVGARVPRPNRARMQGYGNRAHVGENSILRPLRPGGVQYVPGNYYPRLSEESRGDITNRVIPRAPLLSFDEDIDIDRTNTGDAERREDDDSVWSGLSPLSDSEEEEEEEDDGVIEDMDRDTDSDSDDDRDDGPSSQNSSNRNKKPGSGPCYPPYSDWSDDDDYNDYDGRAPPLIVDVELRHHIGGNNESYAEAPEFEDTHKCKPSMLSPNAKRKPLIHNKNIYNIVSMFCRHWAKMRRTDSTLDTTRGSQLL